METKDAVEALSALAHAGRLSILRCLVQAGPGGISAGVLGRNVGMAGSTLSNNLKVLTKSGLSLSRRDGRAIIYSADYARMSGLLAFLMEDCCAGSATIAAPLTDTGIHSCCPRVSRTRLDRIHSATSAWVSLVAELTIARLPTDDLLEPDQYFFGDGGGGYGGLQILGKEALVRSIVIAPDSRQRGRGRQIVAGLVDQALALGATDLWLLTTDQSEFFRACGFHQESRSAAPDNIRQTRQFAGLCPESATVMRRHIGCHADR